MAHCKNEEIEDLKPLLEEILSWEKIQEKGFGKLYLKGMGFLHFHSKDGRRWADVRDGEQWGSEIEVPFNITKTQINKFLKEVRKRYENTF